MPLADNPYTRAKAGYKILQYWAAGLPVVASPVGFNRDLIREGVDGLLATTREEWRAALLRLLGDPALRERLGAAGRQRVREAFSLEVCAAAWGRVLGEVLGSSPEATARPDQG